MVSTVALPDPLAYNHPWTNLIPRSFPMAKKKNGVNNIPVRDRHQ
jgi:hypothetical protein